MSEGAPDLLVGARWECAYTAPGAVAEPAGLDAGELTWLPAQVPGTGAGALREAGLDYLPAYANPDDYDWWFRCELAAAPPGRYLLNCAGLATVADAWLGDEPVLHSETMFTPVERTLELGPAATKLSFRFSALTPLLAARRPRAAWKTRLMRSPGLRWWRTTLIGRMPGTSREAAPVGPWRGVSLIPEQLRLTRRGVTTRLEAGVGIVAIDLELTGPEPITDVVISVGSQSVSADVDGGRVTATLRIPDAALWWPAGYGPQPLYPVTVRVRDRELAVGQVGFRTIGVDTSDGGWTLILNGTRVFARGALWNPPDPVSLQTDPARLRTLLTLARDAGLVMLRIPGTTVYPSSEFLDLCDELGLLVWQDLMIANLPPPDDDGFRQTLTAELRFLFGELAGRPSPAVICGGSEVEQQAAMMGLSAERIEAALGILVRDVPALVDELLPATPYAISSPTGGYPPFRPDAGTTHYFGVGAYLRPLDDARRAGVRFASECLAFSNPPEHETVEEIFGGAHVAGHGPLWKAGVPRDAGTPWDFEDVSQHYVGELYGVDPHRLRFTEPERALDLERAAVAEAIGATLAEWRRPGSTCSGALILSFNDMIAGAGWGLIDSLGRPKSVWYAVRRVCAPIAVFITDEGLGGLAIHVCNDTGAALAAALEVELFAGGEVSVGGGTQQLELAAHSALSVDTEQVLGGFRDVAWSYRFGAAPHDVVVATLRSADGVALSRAIHLPTGRGRAVEPELGLTATFSGDDENGWAVEVTTRRFAQAVHLQIPGWLPQDSWFDLAPGSSRRIRLTRTGGPGDPQGEVAALNAAGPRSIHRS
jgi:beta-mannosidase